MRYPAFAEIKYDGEFNYIYYNIQLRNIHTKNKYGTIKREFTKLQQLYYLLSGNGVKEAILLCELYWGDGKLGALYDLLKHKTDDGVHIRVFDVMMKDGEDIGRFPTVDRKEILWEMIGNWQVKDRVVSNQREVQEEFLKTTLCGYEGIVVKSLDAPLVSGPCSWVKMKYKDRTDYHVGFVDPNKERIEVIVPIVPNGARTFIHVGVKAPNRYKKHIKSGDICTIEHQGALKSGSLRHPVLIKKPEW